MYIDDLYLARMSAEFVTPPHTVANLNKSLSGFEDISENIATSLFISALRHTPMKNARRVSIPVYPGPYYTPNYTIPLVAKFSRAG
jgi:hypothetical protein